MGITMIADYMALIIIPAEAVMSFSTMRLPIQKKAAGTLCSFSTSKMRGVYCSTRAIIEANRNKLFSCISGTQHLHEKIAANIVRTIKQ